MAAVLQKPFQAPLKINFSGVAGRWFSCKKNCGSALSYNQAAQILEKRRRTKKTRVEEPSFFERKIKPSRPKCQLIQRRKVRRKMRDTKENKKIVEA